MTHADNVVRAFVFIEEAAAALARLGHHELADRAREIHEAVQVAVSNEAVMSVDVSGTERR